jgi:hypothetical protein
VDVRKYLEVQDLEFSPVVRYNQKQNAIKQHARVRQIVSRARVGTIIGSRALSIADGISP